MLIKIIEAMIFVKIMTLLLVLVIFMKIATVFQEVIMKMTLVMVMVMRRFWNGKIMRRKLVIVR